MEKLKVKTILYFSVNSHSLFSVISSILLFTEGTSEIQIFFPEVHSHVTLHTISGTFKNIFPFFILFCLGTVYKSLSIKSGEYGG
jgi:hypothetical protein